MSTNDLNEIYLFLGRIEEKVDSLKAQKEEIASIKTRVEKLESWRTLIVGCGVTITALAGFVFKILPLVIR